MLLTSKLRFSKEEVGVQKKAPSRDPARYI